MALTWHKLRTGLIEHEWSLRCDGHYVLTLFKTARESLGRGQYRITFDDSDYVWIKARSLPSAQIEAVRYLLSRSERQIKKHSAWKEAAQTFLRGV